MNYKALSYTILIILGIFGVIILFYLFTLIMTWILIGLCGLTATIIIGCVIYEIIKDDLS